MEWLEGYWMVSAAAGAGSGLVAWLAVRQLYSGREQREYQQSVAAANAEILHAIRPAIAEKIIPSNAVLDALFSATARKYGADARDLLPKAGLANELIKDIVDNAFLSSQQKVEYCELLAGMKKQETALPRRRAADAAFARRADSDPSAMLGLSTGLTAFVMTLFFQVKDRQDFMLDGQPWTVFPMLAAVSIVPIVAYLLVDLARQIARPRREVEEPMPAARREETGPAVPAPGELTALEAGPTRATS